MRERNNGTMSLMSKRSKQMITTIIILLTLRNHLTFVRGQSECISNGNSTTTTVNNNNTNRAYINYPPSNTTTYAAYSADLNALLSSLPSNISKYGFSISSVGAATALALCRADQTPHQCRQCVASAAADLRASCPNGTRAALRTENCTLRYSDGPVLGVTTYSGGNTVSTSNASDENRYFRENVSILLVRLRIAAAEGGSELKAGAGSMHTPEVESETVYALLQCTPALSSEDCRSCLAGIHNSMIDSIDKSGGVMMSVPDCSIRYELYEFYNETRLMELNLLPQPPSSSPSSPPPGRNDDKPDSKTRKKRNDAAKVVMITVPIGVCLALAVSILIYLRKRMKQKRSWEITETMGDISNVESLQYDLGKIRAATADFSDANKLGRGGFGAVYKGKLENGQEIAVKRLSEKSDQGNTEFKNEVLLVAKLQHRNLVRLLGFSLEGMERLLVYEFVQNASLDHFIFDPTKRSRLDWDTRHKIIRGVVRGLVYLHEDSRLRIIHRDLKASNVLLDGDMNPKIADFGMARLSKHDEIQGNTNKIVGTYGYMAPEYAMHGEFSIKSDVFSFGVLILEIISGQKNNFIRRRENVEDLLTLTWGNWRRGAAADMIDPLLQNRTSSSLSQMLKCIHIGLLCVQENAANRPTMTAVLHMLNASISTFPLPSEPAFYMGRRSSPEAAMIQEHNSGAGGGEGLSLNEMSFTELYPR